MPLQYRITSKEGYRTLFIDAKDFPKLPTIEDSPEMMAYVIDVISREKLIDNIVIEQADQYVYYSFQVKLLRELAEVYYKYKSYLSLSDPLKYKKYKQYFLLAFRLIVRDFPYDPALSYIRCKRLLRKLDFLYKKVGNKEILDIASLIKNFLEDFEKTTFYKLIKDKIYGYNGDRSVYKEILECDVKPGFIFVRFLRSIPEEYHVIDRYKIGDSEVLIFYRENDLLYKYFLFPPELFLKEEEYELLTKAREILVAYSPKKEEYVDYENLREKTREIVKKIIMDLSSKMKYNIEEKRLNLLVEIVLRHVIGFGVLEILLQDENIQDISINAPVNLSPIYVYHSNYETCETNIYLYPKEAESWATKLRLISGRPLDEVNPILDTELEIGNARARIAAVIPPLSPKGLAFSIRRHRRNPWTLPLFIKNKMLNSLAAGLLSFLVFGGRSILIAGTRGAGKTSLLTSLMLEIPRKVRIITIEDTLEIPVSKFRDLGYNIQSLKVRSPVAIKSPELSMEDGLRVSLRLGDSALIIGEVRSKEALVLYEAMRAGGVANAVLGTIHAESPYGVYDRVVNDLGVPKTSFKATDIIVITNPIRDPSGLKRYRRVLSITEVRKEWEVDPLKEKGFVDILRYDIKKDELVATQEFLHGDIDVLKSLASRIKVFAGDWDKLFNHILLRAKVKELLVKYSEILGKNYILEAPFVIKANEVFYWIMDKVNEELGYPDEKEVYARFEQWLRETIKQ